MGIIAVMHKVVQVFVKYLWIHLTVITWQGDNLMLGELYSTSFMYIDMSCLYTNHSFILIEHGVNGGGVGLGTSC